MEKLELEQLVVSHCKEVEVSEFVEVLDTSSSCSERARVTQVLVRQRDGEEMLWSFLVAAHCLGFPGNDGTC